MSRQFGSRSAEKLSRRDAERGLASWRGVRGLVVRWSVRRSVSCLCPLQYFAESASKKSPPMPEAERHDVAGGPIGSVVAAFAGFARELASMTGLLFFGADTPSDYVLQKPESTR